MDPKINIIVEAMTRSAEKELKRLNGTVKDTANEGQKANDKWANLQNTWKQAATSFMAIAGAAYAVKKAFDFGKEGAEIMDISDKLDRLAVSIGTTSESITTKLSAAMGGLMSDAEIARSAMDIISLGLADNEDGVVRLATLVGKLGWDMQTVILTFANNSKMRLDSLGLSVSDVEERMVDLEAQGLSTDKAFDMAVIEAGEAKLALLGDAAETNVAAFKRMETRFKNNTDQIKQNIAEAWIPLLDKIDEFEKTVADTAAVADAADSYDEYLKIIGPLWMEVEILSEAQWKARQSGEALTEQTKDGYTAYLEMIEPLSLVNDEVQIFTEEQWEATQAVAGSEGTWRNWYGTVDTATDSIGGIDDATQNWLDRVDNATDDLDAMNSLMETQARLAEDAAAAYDIVSIAISGRLGPATEDFKGKQHDLLVEIGNVKSGILELEDLTYLTPEQQIELDGLKTQLGDLSGQYTANADAHQEATLRILYDLLLQRLSLDGLTADEMTLASTIAESWGLIDQDTYNAVMNIDSYLEDLKEGGTANLQAVIDKVGGLAFEINRLPTEKQIQIRTEMITIYTEEGRQGGDVRQHGGPVRSGQRYLVGEAGPEMFVPRTDGYIVPNSQVNNNYNLSIHTSAQAESALSDFHIMRVLAGV